LSGTSDEWQALLILVKARALSDEHQIGVGSASREHAFPPSSMKLTTRALGRFGCERL
jgi:hypothetical protein